ncbi:ABC-2 family transporter protein [Proteiniborus sp. MB09-C3]|uniref:ABC transporter permease n=1 Tax=Proteiniborus sp. MB09-C3 TaxID=3050072 RepID=UPI00255352C8|nr:ABC-2 family transporter protein [Proteiniborus sp. MB09-C3]WIV12783.1 ABC-2 family transporter protein [Proteiniborus sp. MB09-C3]
MIDIFRGLELAKKSFERDRVYLLNHIVNNIGSIIFGYINVRIWLAVLGNTNEGMEAVTYLMVNQAGLWLVMFLPYGCYIPQKVRDGSIAFEMLRPYGLLYGSFFEVLGHIAYNFLFRTLPILLFGVLIMGVSLPSIYQILPYLSTLFNGILLSFLINYFVGLWSIKFLSINGVQMLYYFASTLFSGAFINLKYYPEFFQRIIMKLPFAYTSYVPTAVYQGQFDLLKACITQWMWIICLFSIAYLLTAKLTKKMTVQGG